MGVFATLVVAAALGQEPCGPAVRLEGDPDLVALVAAELDTRGIGTQPPFECDSPRARVTREGDRLGLEVASHGQLSRRAFGTPVLAAVLIESWVRSDLEGPLLSPPPRPEPAARVAAPAAAPAVREVGRLRGELEAEGTLGSHDGGLGLFAAGCRRYGAFCLGLAARLQQTVLLGHAGTSCTQDGFCTVAPASSDRTGVDALAYASFPWQRGALFVSPLVGVGAGWLRTYVPSPGGAGVSCVGEGPGGAKSSLSGCSGGTSVGSWDASDVGLRLEAGLTAALMAGDHWALQTRLAVSVAPTAHVSALVSPPLQPQAVVLAGEPLWLGRLGLGVEWGGP